MTELSDRRSMSVFIITLDEAEHIGECVRRVRALTDDILVLDSGSTDGTQDIAAAQGARVEHRDFTGFGAQKYAAEQMCRHDWVLNLDADEYLPQESVDEISAFLSRPDLDEFDGARIRIVPVYPGWSKPRLWANDQNRIRLYDRTRLKFPTHPSHDSIEVGSEARIHQLTFGASHHTFVSFPALEQKMQERCRFYFSIEKQPPKLVSLARALIEFPFAFFKCYFLRRHFTGGLDGLHYSWLHAKYRFLRILQRIVGRALV